VDGRQGSAKEIPSESATEIAQIAQAWPGLSTETRRSILAILDAFKRKDGAS
jgi:hypothetical protein